VGITAVGITSAIELGIAWSHRLVPPLVSP
jgi:hypothetical protein